MARTRSLSRRAALLLAVLILLAALTALLLFGLSDDLDRALAQAPQDLPLSAFSPALIRTAPVFHGQQAREIKGDGE